MPYYEYICISASLIGILLVVWVVADQFTVFIHLNFLLPSSEVKNEGPEL